MIGKITRIIYIISSVIITLIVSGSLYYYYQVGFTKNQKYKNCVHICYQIVISESSKQYCPFRCEEVTGFIPIVSLKEN